MAKIRKLKSRFIRLFVHCICFILALFIQFFSEPYSGLYSNFNWTIKRGLICELPRNSLLSERRGGSKDHNNATAGCISELTLQEWMDFIRTKELPLIRYNHEKLTRIVYKISPGSTSSNGCNVLTIEVFNYSFAWAKKKFLRFVQVINNSIWVGLANASELVFAVNISISLPLH